MRTPRQALRSIATECATRPPTYQRHCVGGERRAPATWCPAWVVPPGGGWAWLNASARAPGRRACFALWVSPLVFCLALARFLCELVSWAPLGTISRHGCHGGWVPHLLQAVSKRAALVRRAAGPLRPNGRLGVAAHRHAVYCRPSGRTHASAWRVSYLRFAVAAL